MSPSSSLLSSSPTPSPLPVSDKIGVAVDGFQAGSNVNQYRTLLFDSNGKIVAQATANKRSIHAETTPLPETSISSATVYYLDGDFTLRSLSPNGTTGVAAQIEAFPVSQATADQDLEAAFAVSPDDKHIAVAIDGSGGTRLYVEDLAGGNRRELYKGPIVEWPVGWWNGQIVLQLGDMKTGAHVSQRGYHVVSATTGERSASVCEEGKVFGVPTTAGTLCEKGSPEALFRLAWDASGPAANGLCSVNPAFGAALRSDGYAYAASYCYGHGNDSAQTIRIYDREGNFTAGGSFSTDVTPVGWLDQFVVFRDATSAIRLFLPTPGFGTTGVGLTPEIGQHAIFVGAIPVQLQ